MILILSSLAIVATACGSSIDQGSYKDETSQPSASLPSSTLPPCPKTAVTATKNKGAKPTVTIKNATCSAPATLVSTDLIVGTGAVVKPGATVNAHYLGISWSSKAEFDSSWKTGAPVEFSLTQVIPGWTEAIPGMKVGGRRLLVIPPGKAYGDNPPQGSSIAPGETLIFVVDIVGTK